MDVLEAIFTRRSIREFTNEDVSEADLETLLRAAMAAPSAHNRQPWHFVVVRDKALLAKMAELHPYAKMAAHAPLAIVVCANPAEAKEFVSRSGADSLACAIGTSHGAFKFKGKQSLHFDVLKQIQDALPNFPLVMHGSSSVPKDEVDRINKAGGQIKDSSGVNVEEYLPAAKLGVTKINIDTDGRLVWTRVHREFFRDKPSEFDFRPVGKTFMDEYAKFIISRNQLLGSAGQLDAVRASLTK